MNENHIKENTFDKLKEKFNLQNDIFSLIKEEYSTSCKYIHGGEILKSELLFYFLEFLKKENEIFRDLKYYKRIIKMLNIYDNLILKKDEEFINGVFHRRKTLLKFLIKID